MTQFTLKDGTILEIKNGEILAVATVTVARGSWKYQDAFRNVWYRPRYSARQKKHFWEAVFYGYKYAQGPRLGYSKYPSGSLHNRPVSASDMMAIATLSEVL